MTGFLITFEGVERSGKTTHLAHLSDYLKKKGCRILVTREPGGTKIGERIRDLLLGAGEMDPVTELFLFLADRAQHAKEIVLPALREGKIVLCDRWTDSTLAYQGYGRGLKDKDIIHAVSSASGGLTPHLTFLLTLPLTVGLARLHRRSGMDRLEREHLNFHERVRKGYLRLAAREPRRIKVIHTDRRIDEVDQEIHEITERRLRQRFRR